MNKAYFPYQGMFVLSSCIYFFVYIMKENTDKSIKKIFAFFIYVPLWLLSAFRAPQVGADTFSYLDAFHGIENYKPSEFFNVDLYSFEYGYIVFMKIVNYISSDDQMILIVTSFITVFSVAIFLYKTSYNFYLSTILYIGLCFFMNQMTPIRQSLGFACILYACYLMLKNKRITPIILTFLASTLHASLLIFLPFFLFYPYNLRKVKVAIWVIFIVTIFMFWGGLSMLGDFFSFTEKYMAYYELAMIGGESVFGPAIIKGIICIGTSFIGMHILKNEKKSDEGDVYNMRQFLYLIIVLCATAGCVMILSYSIGFLGRMIDMFFFFECILIPFIVKRISPLYRVYFAPIFLIILYLYMSYILSVTLSMEYKSVLN